MAVYTEGTKVKGAQNMTHAQFKLVDDGTLDTVLECRICGGVERFSPEDFEGIEDEDNRIDVAMDDAAIVHMCQIEEMN